ncbi:hypothetical protein F4778DRAFT_731469 [Xylariomycetidae sp. FL2044]|nr:hypothetical protein F4778DRAFT_731469 [Xylariomycetidae sp. FL2044]
MRQSTLSTVAAAILSSLPAVTPKPTSPQAAHLGVSSDLISRPVLSITDGPRDTDDHLSKRIEGCPSGAGIQCVVDPFACPSEPGKLFMGGKAVIEWSNETDDWECYITCLFGDPLRPPVI